MAKSKVSSTPCPHCAAPLDYLRRGCGTCERRVPWEWTEPCQACGAAADYTDSYCANCDARLSVWDGIAERIRGVPAHVDFRIAKDAVPHPRTEGFVRHTGDPRGQHADYRRPLPDGSGLHVKEYADRFDVHWDKVDPTESFLGHLVADAPHWFLFGGLAAFRFRRVPVAALLGLAGIIKR